MGSSKMRGRPPCLLHRAVVQGSILGGLQGGNSGSGGCNLIIDVGKLEIRLALQDEGCALLTDSLGIPGLPLKDKFLRVLHL